ncbi:hypothetical protein ACZ90_30455 [Streptomyces albus subsp. albus]|nr:hypothetical protein ACZ90_30455 [Streptomyces albus subsp. albus]
MPHDALDADPGTAEDPTGPPGLGGMLRNWRARAGRRLDLGKPLPQIEVAASAGMSERWYRDLERGAIPRLDRRVLALLADVLLLDADERATLYLYALGGTPYEARHRPGDARDLSALQELVDRQLPRPACLTDRSWNVIGRNRAMTEWFPWSTADDANLLRWALTSPEAREQLTGWPWHARMHLGLIRFAMAQHPGDPGLTALVRDVLRDPVCRRLWQEGTCVVAHRDGHRFRLRLPHVAPGTTEVVTRVLIPAGHQDLRLVILT